MKRIAAALLICCLAPAVLCGCRSLFEGRTPPPYMTEAVLRSFADIFDGSWGGVTIYVQKSACIPPDFRAAGKNPVVVTTMDNLVRKYEDSDTCPAIAVVDASQDKKSGLIRVTVKYVPVRIAGLAQPAKGGNFEYIYELVDGKLIMISRLKPMM